MHPEKVIRERVVRLTDLPNVGKAGEQDLRLLGIDKPSQLAERCPFEMYRTLCEITGVTHDPCMIDVFMSITRFINGEPARAWWSYTEERKRILSKRCTGSDE